MFVKLEDNILIRKDQIVACRKKNDPSSGDYYLVFERLGDYDDIWVCYDTESDRDKAFDWVYMNL